MARGSSVGKELDDMTECCICTEVFTDPRVLPCIHTFCLKCLLGCGKDKQPGDSMACPLCRKEFTIPDNGLAGTQKNFFMEKLLHARTLPAGQEVQHIPCDVCSSNEASADETVKPASMYCVQCQQNCFEQCSLYYKKMKTSSTHTQVDAGRGSVPEEILQLSATMCEQHKGKEIEVFCRECKVAVCMMCVIMSHRNHDCLDIEKASEDLRKLILGDTRKVSDMWKVTEDVLPRLDKEKNDVIKHLAGIEDEINTAADKLIAAIQRDRLKLLLDVGSIKAKRIEELEMVKQELEQHMTALESFRRYSETLLSSGTACDVTRSANSLHDRADKLMKFDVIGHVDSTLPPVNVTFTSSRLLERNAEKRVGSVTEEACSSSSPTVTHVIPQHNRGLEVTSLGDEVFVLHSKFPWQKIEVYDAKTFTFQRHITVPGFGHRSLGLAACLYYNCLYASDYDNHSVHRVELSGNNAATKWSVARPAGLSVNSEHNLLVVSQAGSKLQIFTTDGTLLQNIQLQADIEHPGPRHAVQLPSGQFLVCYEGALQRVCLVGVDGAVVRSYGGQKGSQLTQLSRPVCLSVDREGRVLVADWLNNRLLVIDQSLSSAHEMSVCVDGGLKGPWSLWYDQSRRRLYVGEWTLWASGRVIVIDNMKDFSAVYVNAK